MRTRLLLTLLSLACLANLACLSGQQSGTQVFNTQVDYDFGERAVFSASLAPDTPVKDVFLWIDQHQKPSGGGEFLASSIARAQWGIWKNASVFNGTPAGLATMWDATNPKIAKLAFEFGNAPLGCYPTYLVGLARLASTQAGSAAGNAIRAELALENMGNGYGDITVPGDPYYTTNPTNPLDNLWITLLYQ